MPAISPSADVWGIDAGGSRTTAVVVANSTETRKEFGSISVGTVGSESAATVLGQVLDYVRSRLMRSRTSFGCVGCSSMPVAMESPYPDVLVKVIESRAPAGTILTANDMVPLLYAPPMNGIGLVVSSGTGSCVLGRNEDGQLAKVGGHEHIVSDEGSAYSLGRAALRAAAAAHDGTGPRTVLLERVLEHYGLTIPALGKSLAERRSARATVAGFAPVLLDCGADPVARRIIGENAASLAEAVRVALDRLALPIGPRRAEAGRAWPASADVCSRWPGGRSLDGVAAARAGDTRTWASRRRTRPRSGRGALRAHLRPDTADEMSRRSSLDLVTRRVAPEPAHDHRRT
jgi:N-acetylglucosamine kinase-like BadF-type ATPase